MKIENIIIEGIDDIINTDENVEEKNYLNLKSRKTFYSKDIETGFKGDRFSITQGRNLLYVAWDDYDGEVIASNVNLTKLKNSIHDYIENAYHLEEE